MRERTKLTYEEMLELRLKNHAVYGYIRQGVLVVDGFRHFLADKKTCMVANAPLSELRVLHPEKF